MKNTRVVPSPFANIMRQCFCLPTVAICTVEANKDELWTETRARNLSNVQASAEVNSRQEQIFVRNIMFGHLYGGKRAPSHY